VATGSNFVQGELLNPGMLGSKNQGGDRYIPMRGGNENELQNLLMDISLDESGAKKESAGTFLT